MRSVTDYCDRAMLISDGRIKLIKDPHTVAEAYSETNRAVLGEHELVAPEDTVQNGAKILSVSVRDPASPGKKKFFNFAEEIEIAVEYEFLKNVRGAAIDMGVKLGRNGAYYFYTNSEEHGLTINGKKGEIIELVCKLKNIFSAGIFYVATSLYNPETLEVYARDRQAARFATGDTPASGIVHPDHEFFIRERK